MKKIIIILIGIIFLSGCSLNSKNTVKQIQPEIKSQTREIILGADSGGLNPGTMATSSIIGTVTWNNINNAKLNDGLYADSDTLCTPSCTIKDYEIKIIKSDGTIGSTNKASADAWPYSAAYTSYGSSVDLWGEVWTSSDINNSNFGVAISAYGDLISYYLKATNFGFSIPTGSTINGIIMGFKKFRGTYAAVDYIDITVYYTNTCTYSGSGDWNVLQSDNCYATSDIYVNGAFNLIGGTGSFGCAPGVTVSATRYNFGAPTNIDAKCLKIHL